MRDFGCPRGGSSSDAPGRHGDFDPDEERSWTPAAASTSKCPSIERDELGAGAIVRGPAVIVEDDTTTVIPARFDARVDPRGYIVMERRGSRRPAVTSMPEGILHEIHRHVMWNRLLSVVEEQAQTLVRTAFSTSVRESGDLAAGVFDRQGRMLAQAVTGTPGHINAMAEAVVHFIAEHPVDTMEPGDVFITNDPWLTSGHLHDVTVVTPTFYRDRVVALFANTCHVVDIGGRGFGPDARQVFEEGVNIPILPSLPAGRAQPDAPRDRPHQRARAAAGHR